MKFHSLFTGRNGPDGLGTAFAALACLFLLPSLLFQGTLGEILWYLGLFCLLYSLFRLMSRNLVRRQHENAWFLKRVDPLLCFRDNLRRRKEQKRLYSFFKCPSCGTVLRVPKGKGRIRITCKNCKCVFERNS